MKYIVIINIPETFKVEAYNEDQAKDLVLNALFSHNRLNPENEYDIQVVGDK